MKSNARERTKSTFFIECMFWMDGKSRNRANSWFGACLGKAQMMTMKRKKKKSIPMYTNTSTSARRSMLVYLLDVPLGFRMNFAINSIKCGEQMKNRASERDGATLCVHFFAQVDRPDRRNNNKHFAIFLRRMFFFSIYVSGTFCAQFLNQNIYPGKKKKNAFHEHMQVKMKMFFTGWRMKLLIGEGIWTSYMWNVFVLRVIKIKVKLWKHFGT